MAIDPREFKNILLFHFGQLGDVVLALPAIAAVRGRFPAARITAVTGLVAGEVVRLSGLVDEVVAVDRVELRDGPRLTSIRKIIELARDIRRRDAELVIDLHSLKETNILARITRARSRLLSQRGNRSYHWLGNFDPSPPPEDRSLHLSRTYMRVLGPLGIDHEPEPAAVTPSYGACASVKEKLLNVREPIAGFFPGAGHPSRCWPLSKFAEVAARLQEAGYSPVVFLGPEEMQMRGAVAQAFPPGTLVMDGLGISEFIAAVAQNAIFISNDTGPTHLAALAGVPLLLIMDKDAPLTYLPLAKDLRVVNNASIGEISARDVYSAAMDLLPGVSI